MDRLIWRFDSSGEYTVKSGYNLLQENNQPDVPAPINIQSYNKNWSKLWKVKAHLKAIMLLWRICTNCTAVKTNIAKRIEHFDTSCPLCKTDEEDEDHLFLRCSFAKALWFGSDMGLKVSFLHSHKITDIIWDFILNGEILNSAGTKLAALIWNIWLARNESCFKGKCPNPTQTLYQFFYHAGNWEKNFELVNNEESSNRVKSTRNRINSQHMFSQEIDYQLLHIAWEKTDEGYGGAIILSNQAQVYQAIKSMPFSNLDANLTKLTIIRDGLLLASRFNTKVVIVMKNDHFMADILAGTRMKVHWEYQPLVEDINKLKHWICGIEFAQPRRNQLKEATAWEREAGKWKFKFNYP